MKRCIRLSQRFATGGRGERRERDRLEFGERIGLDIRVACRPEESKRPEPGGQPRECHNRTEGKPAEGDRGQRESAGQRPAPARGQCGQAQDARRADEAGDQHERRRFEGGSGGRGERGMEQRTRKGQRENGEGRAKGAPAGRSRHFGRSLAKKGGMEKIRAPRGTADVYPPESARWQEFEARARAVARRFGYGEIRTPMFEATELFVRGVGETTDIVEKEMYTFEDKGGRSLTLRPEWTAPVVRAMLEHNLLANGPQRLFYVGPFFRYERPQAGRYRQANQFGIECFGFAGPEADVEVMALAHELLRSYDIPGVTLNINSIGDACCRLAYREALLAYFRPHLAELSADSQRRLERNPLRILDSKESQDRALIAAAPAFVDHLCHSCSRHFDQVQLLLGSAGIPFTVDPRLVRGFDYYTRTVFEFSSDALGAQSAVCGGGRYDELVQSLGGPETPAVGFGLGIERFLMVLDAAGKRPIAKPEGLAVIALGAAGRARSVSLVAALRRASNAPPITIDYHDAKIAAQFKRAERAGASAAVILGDDELARNEVVVRDLSARTQDTIAAKDDDAATAEAILRWYHTLPADRSAVREAV